MRLFVAVVFDITTPSLLTSHEPKTSMYDYRIAPDYHEGLHTLTLVFCCTNEYTYVINEDPPFFTR